MTTPTNRIDHSAEALRITTEVVEAILPTKKRGDIPLPLMQNLNANAAREISVAQVHATLALVEQQRIANLIALSQATYPNGSRVDSWAITEPEGMEYVRVKPEIRKGLGL